MNGVFSLMVSKSSTLSGIVELVRDGDEVQHGVGRAAGSADGGDGVLDVTRA